MQLKNSLLCTFSKKYFYKKDISNIMEYYGDQLDNNRLYVLQHVDDPVLCYITYNVTSDKDFFRKTIALHRKKESNILYSLDGLNALVREQNNGIEDKRFSVDWSLYHDCILLVSEGHLNAIPTRLLDIYNIND